MLELKRSAMAQDRVAGLALSFWPTEPDWLPDELAEISATTLAGRRAITPQGAALLAVSFMSEQLPNRSSAIRLAPETDALGRRLALVDWRLGSADLELLHLSLRRFQEAIRSTGQGTVLLPSQPDPTEDAYLTQHWSGHRAALAGSHHHMGTTRMDPSPDQGVVDVHCRHHQLDNLFLAGSSVFPTGGYANPTLTIAALGRRLGHHLITRHRGSAAQTGQ
jgi:choline dehydrogenase-like flavoprotein